MTSRKKRGALRTAGLLTCAAAAAMLATGVAARQEVPAGAAPAPAPAPVTLDEKARPTVTDAPPPQSAEPGAAERPVDLVSSFDLGLRNDPTFRAAVAERDANRQVAGQTIAGYLPSASYNYANIPTETGARHVAQVTQPIFSMSGLATIRQRGPRRRFADATFEVRAQDLAVRVLTAVVEIIRAREASVLNDARIDAFRTQAARAEKLYSNGLGTITDARDIQVRYEQALANRVLLRSDQIAAVERLRSITGVEPAADAFALSESFGQIVLEPVNAYLMAQSAENPQIAAARETERISRLEVARIRGSMLPVVGVSATMTRRSGVDDGFVGLSVNVPLNAGTFFQAGAASASSRRAFEERRQTEEKARTELMRLYAMVDGGQQALVISAKAIEAAELSVEANSKSYEGGVRTNVDVVNAIQVRFEVQNAYVQAATKLALDYLNLLLLAAVPPEDALAATQRFLLGR